MEYLTTRERVYIEYDPEEHDAPFESFWATRIKVNNYNTNTNNNYNTNTNTNNNMFVCLFVVFKIRVLYDKVGGRTVDYTIALDGNTTSKECNNFPYYLLEYIKDLLNDNTATFDSVIVEKRLVGKIFPRSRDTYNELIRNIASLVGYKNNMKFTLHSFRSGFIYDCLVSSSNNFSFIDCVGEIENHVLTSIVL